MENQNRKENSALINRNRKACRWLAVLPTAAILLLGIRALTGLPILPSGCEQRAVQVRILETFHSPRLADVLDSSMAAIPAGEFWMGSDTGRSDEYPLHRVTLDAFTIDCFEVTNTQYAQYLKDSSYPAPDYWVGNEFPNGKESVPVVGVSWEEANAYCIWDGKRLPTEAEWEKAARGTNALTYPWGDQWDPTRANLFLLDSSELISTAGNGQAPWDLAWQLLTAAPAGAEMPFLAAVGLFPRGQSPYGVMDMAGNASEWVADWYNWNDYSLIPAENPLVSGPQWNHVVRGSAWFDPAGDADWVKQMSRASSRNSSHVTSDPRIGFRCAKSTEDANP